MKTLIQIVKPVSLLALLLIVVPPVLVYQHKMSVDAMNHWLLAGTIIWFITTPLWMKSE